MNNSKYILIGGAWPYANSSLHLGHLAALISGDVLARYHRKIGNNVIFVSGTDCHGTPITERAKKEKVNPKEIAEKYHEEFQDCFNKMNFSYDLYTKTMDEYHKEKVEAIFKKIYDNGYIYKKVDEDNYCEHCKKFVSDRELKLICPSCGLESKGDQCDCGYIPTKEYLKGAICNTCNNPTINKPNTNLYLALSKLQPNIEEYLKANEKNWRKNAQNESNKYIKEGLRDRAVTRNLDWGVNIPIDGFEDKRMYVWIDAVLGYLTATMKFCEDNNLDWKNWWKDSKNAKIYMVHGKDNIIFHSIILPGLLIALNDNLKLPDMIVSTEYLNFHDQKFSKSKGVGITVKEAIERFNTDTLRFYLLKNGPESKDSNFTEDDYIMTHNEIVNKLGNFVNRTLKYKGLENIIKSEVDLYVKEFVVKKYNEISKHIENIEFRSACISIIELLDFANKYYDEQKPWIQIKENLKLFEKTIYTCATLIINIANLIEPFMPVAAKNIKQYIGINKNCWKYIEIKNDIKLENIEPLFTKF